MYYKEDFSLKCNKNNCTGIIIAQYHPSATSTHGQAKT